MDISDLLEMLLNMWWIRLLIILLTYINGNLGLRDIKIWKFDPTHTQHGNGGPRNSHITLNNMKTIQYDPNELRRIGHHVHHNNRYKILPFNAIEMITNLKLNNKRKSRNSHQQIPFIQNGVNKLNLITIKKIHDYDTTTILATCNLQSLRGKELQISELINEYAIDILILTETWLTNKDKDWCNTTKLNRNHLQLHTVNRQTGRGRGLALICKSHLKVKVIKNGSTSSFEYATWGIMTKNKQIFVTGIYHQPYSNKNRITNKMFINDFTIFTSTLLADHTNNVLVGHFNLNTSKEDHLEAATFTDTGEAFGLYQYMTFPMHNSGNILDLVLTELCGNINVLRTHRGPFISDHTAVITQLHVKQCDPAQQTKVIQKVKTFLWISGCRHSRTRNYC